MRRRLLAGVVVLLLVAGCAPAAAPIGGQDRVCGWVREAVANGSMPLGLAQEFYPWCGPFEVRP